MGFRKHVVLTGESAQVDNLKKKLINIGYKKMEGLEDSNLCFKKIEKELSQLKDDKVVLATDQTTARVVKNKLPKDFLWVNLQEDDITACVNSDMDIKIGDLNEEKIFAQIIIRIAIELEKSNAGDNHLSPLSFNERTETVVIKAQSVDDLVTQGVKFISQNGIRFESRAGSGIQAYNVNYILEGSLNRVHVLRDPKSVKYFARELLAYFKGSLNVADGLDKASKFWKSLADENGNICSNYGYYTFHQRLEYFDGKTQFEWVIENLTKNKYSRKAVININQPYHKSGTKDFPCTIAMQYYIRDNYLCSEVMSRSTDVYTGLPYDMGFFSLITELVYSYLLITAYPDLKLGHTTMKTVFTQIYDKTNKQALALCEHNSSKNKLESEPMPLISDPMCLLDDIYKGSMNSQIMKWAFKNSEI